MGPGSVRHCNTCFAASYLGPGTMRPLCQCNTLQSVCRCNTQQHTHQMCVSQQHTATHQIGPGVTRPVNVARDCDTSFHQLQQHLCIHNFIVKNRPPHPWYSRITSQFHSKKNTQDRVSYTYRSGLTNKKPVYNKIESM